MDDTMTDHQRGIEKIESKLHELTHNLNTKDREKAWNDLYDQTHTIVRDGYALLEAVEAHRNALLPPDSNEDPETSEDPNVMKAQDRVDEVLEALEGLDNIQDTITNTRDHIRRLRSQLDKGLLWRS